MSSFVNNFSIYNIVEKTFVPENVPIPVTLPVLNHYQYTPGVLVSILLFTWSSPSNFYHPLPEL